MKRKKSKKKAERKGHKIVVSDPVPPSQLRGGDPDKTLEEKLNRKWWQL